MQRAPAQWIIIAAISLSLLLVLMPSGDSNNTKRKKEAGSHNPNHGHHEHDNEHKHEKQKPQEKGVPAGHKHADDHKEAAEEDSPYIPKAVPHHLDHGQGAGKDVLFTMPRPGVRGDLLEAEINPKHAFFGGEKSGNNDHMNPRSVMWQTPPGKPIGVLILFHGCNHDGSDWFNGPAERRIVAHALAQGFITIAMQAGARHGAKCWHNDWPVVINNDVIAIRSAMDHFFQHPTRKPWTNLPIYALGASSGGVFASIYARVWPFDGICIAVAPGLRDAFAFNPALRPIPSVAFIYMKGDKNWASKIVIEGQVERLLERRLASKAFAVGSKQITVPFLYSYLDLPKDRVEKIHQTMLRLEMIDTEGALKADPRTLACGERVTQELKKEEPGYDWGYWQYGIQQMANLAEGVHEISFEQWPEALAWMRTQDKI